MLDAEGVDLLDFLAIVSTDYDLGVIGCSLSFNILYILKTQFFFKKKIFIYSWWYSFFKVKVNFFSVCWKSWICHQRYHMHQQAVNAHFPKKLIKKRLTVSQLGKKALLNFWSSSQMIHSYIRVELRKKKKNFTKRRLASHTLLLVQLLFIWEIGGKKFFIHTLCFFASVYYRKFFSFFFFFKWVKLLSRLYNSKYQRSKIQHQG